MLAKQENFSQPESLDSRRFFDFAVPLAREVGAYQRQKLSQEHDVAFKGAINLITEVDKACEIKIVSAIQKNFPDHDILAEEGTGPRKDSPFKWIIDPLDGTTNYAHGYPLFTVSIAVEYRGTILAGVVYDPMRDELFKAYHSQGAFLNDRAIRVSRTDKLNHALLGTGFAYNLRKTKNNNLNHFQNLLLKAQAVRRDGVASIDICYVACGRYDGFWELCLFPWDTAAGIVIATEAGGRVSRFDGSDFTVYEKDILVTNGRIHDEVSRVLKKGMRRRRF